MNIFNVYLTELHVHAFICLAYLIFGLAPVAIYRSKGWTTCLKKLRLFYIIIGLSYLTLIYIEHQHPAMEQHSTIETAHHELMRTVDPLPEEHQSHSHWSCV